jgi:outer membrane receptor for ferrienterochelin and colicins
MKKTISILVSGVLFGLQSHCLYANNDLQETQNKKAKLEKLLLLSLEELLEVKISVASRQEELLKDAPSSVTVFTHEELRNMGIKNIEELLNYMPSLQSSIDVHTGAASVISRGILSTEAMGVLFLLNGQRMNEHYTGSGLILNSFMNIENVEQIEIIRGPGSALYGSNAFLGVINIITNRTHNNITAEVGTNNSYRTSISAHEKVNDWKLSGFASVHGDKGQHYNNVFDRYYQTRETKDPKHGADISFEADYQDFYFGLHHSQRDSKDFYQLDYLANGLAEKNTAQTLFNLKWKTFLTPQLQTQLGLSGFYSQWDSLTRLAPAGITPPFMVADYIAGPVYSTRLITLSNDWAYSLNKNHLLSFGFQSEFSDMPKAYINSNYNVLNYAYLGRITVQANDMSRFVDNKNRQIQSVYFEDNYRWNDDFHSIVGARYDHYNDFGSALKPRLALIYTTPWKDNIKLMYGEAYRAPTLSALWSKNNPLIIGNPSLKAENISTAEVSYIHTTPQRQIALTYFYNKLSDMYQNILIDPVWKTIQPQNLGSGHVEGVELEISQQIDKHWLFKANVSKILNNNLQTGFSPTYFGSAILNYSKNDWTFNISSYLRAPISELPNQGRMVIFNALARYNISKPFSVELTANNLFDKTYYDAQTGGGLGTDLSGNIVRAIPRRGREIFLGINYHF